MAVTKTQHRLPRFCALPGTIPFLTQEPKLDSGIKAHTQQRSRGGHDGQPAGELRRLQAHAAASRATPVQDNLAMHLKFLGPNLL